MSFFTPEIQVNNSHFLQKVKSTPEIIRLNNLILRKQNKCNIYKIQKTNNPEFYLANKVLQKKNAYPKIDVLKIESAVGASGRMGR